MAQLNGQNVAGAAFLLFSALLLYAGQVNSVFGKLYPAYYILLAAGTALVLLGYRTATEENRIERKQHFPLTG